MRRASSKDRSTRGARAACDLIEVLTRRPGGSYMSVGIFKSGNNDVAWARSARVTSRDVTTLLSPRSPECYRNVGRSALDRLCEDVDRRDVDPAAGPVTASR